MHEITRKIGLGTVQFGMTYGISNRQGQTSPEEVAKILKLAEQKEIELLDTASAYGNSEQVLGKNDLSAFKVVSKFMPPDQDHTLKNQIDRTLRDLNLPSLFGYLAHRPDHLSENISLWQELIELKKKGFVEKIGISLNKPEELETLIRKKVQPDIIQVPFNYLDRRFEDWMVLLKNDGCEVHSRSAFLQGLFFMDINRMDTYFDELVPVIENLQRNIENLAGSLLNFAISQPFIDRVIVGVETKAQLRENIDSLSSAESLPELRRKFPESLILPSNWPAYL